MKIDGNWIGFFKDPRVGCPKGGHEFGIRARFEAHGTRLEGTMTDLEPVKAVPCRELYDSQSPRMSAQESAVCKSYLERYPELVVEFVLPENSTLSGTIQGDKIRFEKHYDRGQRFVWRSGTTVVDSQDLPRHKVCYEGTVDPATDTMRGTWTIHKRGLAGLSGEVVGHGEFELRREEAS